MLKEGDKMPINILLQDKDGKEVTLKNYLDKYLVIYFYPKDETTGCTIEACEFRDYNKDIERLGAKIIGISRDNTKSHNKFKDKHSLNFTLLSDPLHKLNDAFGVWVEKSMYGRKYMGTQRSTFVVNPDGIIVKVWEKVKPEGHAKEVYEALKTITNS